MAYPRRFIQRLHPGGYEVVQGRRISPDGSLTDTVASFVVSRISDGENPFGVASECKIHEPMEDNKRLFFRFYRLADAPNSEITQFANKFGYLNSDLRQQIKQTDREERGIFYAEPVELWRQTAREMTLAIRLRIKLAEQRPRHVDYKFLEETIRQQTDRTELFFPPEEDGIPALVIEEYIDETSLFLGSDRLIDELTQSLEGYSKLDVARHFLSEFIQRHLAGLVYPYMSYTVGEGENIGLVPTSLLGALWLQFAFAVHSGKEFRICKRPWCNNAFLAEHEDGRFCNTDTCKKRAQRESKRQAVAANS